LTDNPASPVADHAVIEDFMEANPHLLGRWPMSCLHADSRLIESASLPGGAIVRVKLDGRELIWIILLVIFPI
jgi:hypothetical protein